MHLVRPTILYNHRDRFLIGRLLFPGEIGNNGYAKFGGLPRSIMVYVKMPNTLLEHLLLKTLFFIFYFPIFVLSTNICNIRVQLLLICFSLKKANVYNACKSGFK